MNYIDINDLTREELIYNLKAIRNPIYQRIQAMRGDNRYSQVGVDAYDKQVKWLRNRFEWFNPTGSMANINKATTRDLRTAYDRMLYLDSLHTTNRIGAKQYQNDGEYIMKGYSKLSSGEQSAVWRLTERLREQNPDLTSYETIVLLRRKLDGGDIYFSKDNNGYIQVNRIVDKDGVVFSQDHKGGEMNLYDIMDGLAATFNETLSYINYLDDRKELRKKRAEHMGYVTKRL